MSTKIIFTDLDGTLLDHHQQIGPKTKALVAELKRRGIPFVPVSARMPGAIIPLMQQLGVTTPMVCFNGGLLKNEAGATIASTPIPHEIVARALATIEKAHQDMNIPIARNIYSETKWMTEHPESEQAKHESEVLLTQPTKVCYDTVLEGDTPIYKLSCCTHFELKEETRELERRLSEALPELAVHCSAGWYIELSAATSTKGNGLRSMCKLLGIPVEDSIAFGDNFNDIDMLQAAGLGVCMANGPAQVKAIADDVTEKTNDEEGLAEYLWKLL
ncbi:MAG: HAD family hydrolase [Lachnospiraceae bacterium]|nr:HAD family hydrolase [Lachnospiraceae bacterium]